MYLLVNVLEQPEHLVAILDNAIAIVKSLCGDLCEPGKGILFAVPLSLVEGMPEEV